MPVSQQEGWFPRAGSWEEAVVSWPDQVNRAFARQARLRREAHSDARTEPLAPSRPDESAPPPRA